MGLVTFSKISVQSILERTVSLQQKASSGAMTMTKVTHPQMTTSLHRKVFPVYFLSGRYVGAHRVQVPVSNTRILANPSRLGTSFVTWAPCDADEEENAVAEAVKKQHKRSFGSQIERKMDALLQAEEAFSSRQGGKEQEPVCTKPKSAFFLVFFGMAFVIFW